MNTQKVEIHKMDDSIQPTQENIQKTFRKIEEYTKSKEYRLVGDLNNVLVKFDSHSQEKTCGRYLTRIDRRPGMQIINKFLHFLYKKVMKIDGQAPYVEYSEKELKIKEARKAWKKVRDEAEKLRLAYKQEKGDFYKTK